MNVDRIAQVSPYLSGIQLKADHQTATTKMANDQLKADGQAALQLIEAAANISGTIGSNVNVKV